MTTPKANIRFAHQNEPQVFFFLEEVLKPLLSGREFIACHFESPVQSANGRNIADHQVETTPNVLQDVTCCVRLLTLLHVAAFCWELLHRLHTTATRTQQHATWLAQQCWELLFHLRLGNSTWEFLGVIFSSRDFGGRGRGGDCRKP